MVGQAWEYEIAGVYRGFYSARPGDDGPLLRALHAALRSAPPTVSQVLGAPCRTDELDRLLAGRCLYDAAFVLTGRAGLLVSRSFGGDGHATVIAEGLFDETSYRAVNVPLAIGGALAAGLALWAHHNMGMNVSRVAH